MRLHLALAVVAAGLAIAPVGHAGTIQDPVNFTEQTYATGLGQITGLSWGIRGGHNYLFICNRTGGIFVVRDGVLQMSGGQPQRLDTSGANGVSPIEFNSYSEMGLENILADVDFGGANPTVYIFVSESTSQMRVHKYAFSEAGGVVSLTGKTQVGPTLPTVGANHDGGGMAQQSDGQIYFAVGNLGNGTGQSGSGGEFNTLASKICRMNRAGNPMGGSSFTGMAGDARYIFAKGFRNPFGLRMRPGTNQLWLSEVGDGSEQIFLVTENSDQHYPTENNTTNPAWLMPKYRYPTNGPIFPGGPNGNCLTRMTFYNGGMFPGSFSGDVFFCEYAQSVIVHAKVGANDMLTNLESFVTGAQNPTDINVGPDGAVYYAASGAGQVKRIYYNLLPNITTQPVSVTKNEGQTATFTVAATNATSYQWQRQAPGSATWTSIAGATGTSYTTPVLGVTADNQSHFRVVVSNANGSVNSTSVTLTVNYNAPVITQQPTNQTVTAPAMATFTVTATGTSLTYQWQQSTDGGVNWAPIAGATAASYTTSATTAGMNNYRYRVVVTAGGSVMTTSTGAILTVQTASTPASITTQPVSQSVTAPATATFTVVAGGTAPLTYQWQKQDPGTATFIDIPGATSASYTTPATTLVMSGTQYRVVVDNAFGGPVTSAPATLTVSGPAVATPVINPGGGTFSGPVTIKISSSTPSSTIHYTTDNSTPTGGSPTFPASLQLTTTTTIKAIATAPGMTDSAVATAVFTITGGTPYGLPYRDPVSGINVGATPGTLPTTLSGTGLFTGAGSLTATTGIVPFAVNSPLWSDHAIKQRWIALPAGQKVTFSATNDWTFPTGTVFVKHFDLPVDDTNPTVTRRVETRVLYVNGGNTYGATYKWRADNSDADLMTNQTLEVTEDISIATGGAPRIQTWHYPSRDDCLKCHTPAAGYVLGPKTRQLNRQYAYPGGVQDNQLRTWNYLQMFSNPVLESTIPTLPKLFDVGDGMASLEDRSRSYFDSNCSMCHRGPIPPAQRAQWDGRWTTPLANQGIIDVVPLADTLGLTNARIVAPGLPASSVLLSRIDRLDTYRMPPLASHVIDQIAVNTITAWIGSLTPTTTPPPPPPPPPPPAAAAAPEDTTGVQRFEDRFKQRCGCNTAGLGSMGSTLFALALVAGLTLLRRR